MGLNKLTSEISFKPLEQSDFKQIYDWIAHSHVSKWRPEIQDWFKFKQKFEDKVKSAHH